MTEIAPVERTRRGPTLPLGRLTHGIILLAILCTPLFAIGEVLGLLSGTLRSQTVALTPVYVKALRDVLLLLLMATSVGSMLATGRTHRLLLPTLGLGLYLLAAALQATSLDPRLSLAGLRWALPVLLPMLLVFHVNEAFLQRIARLLSALFLLHFAMQIVELFFMSPWFGTTLFGLAARVPGILFIPNTAGFFSVMVLYFALFHLSVGFLRSMLFVLVPLSVLLTQSGTGLIVLFLLAALVVVRTRRALLLLPVAPALGALLLAGLPLLTGRGYSYVSVSGGTRVQLFRELASSSEWFPTSFGVTTNTAASFAATFRTGMDSAFRGVTVDSTFASILGNLGLLGFIGFGVAFAVWLIIMLRTQRVDLYAMTMIFALYGATTIISETFPMNLLFGVLGAYFLRVVYLPSMRPAEPSNAAQTWRSRPVANSAGLRTE
jgi:hypothetical protein